MIIQQLTGGMGNQMFQYAAARTLTLDLETELYLDATALLDIPFGKKNLRHYELHHFNSIQKFKKPHFHWIKKYYHLKNIYPKLNYYLEPGLGFNANFFDIKNNTYLEGVFQSEKYFIKHEKAIRNELTFKDKFEGKNEEIYSKIKNVNAISVHVRRGDYVSNPYTNQMHGTCTPEYYKNAIDKLAKDINDPYFFMFSDEPEWVMENLKPDYPFEIVSHNKGENSYNDMHLMSLCKHHIIANSSFSWWGAWLNPDKNKRVIAPKNWFSNPNWNSKDIVPDSWIKM